MAGDQPPPAAKGKHTLEGRDVWHLCEYAKTDPLEPPLSLKNLGVKI